jgi:3-phenylpropionate/trans-cinnamate dioxygenase ferredoxin reductase subunit
MLARSVSHDRLPYFYSDQYDMGMEYSGYTTHWTRSCSAGPRQARVIAF